MTKATRGTDPGRPKRAVGAPGGGDPAAVTDAGAAAGLDADEVAELEALVGDWVTVPDLAQRWRVPVTRVRTYLSDKELLALRLGPNRALHVPAKLTDGSGPRPELRGTLTVLSDGGMNDAEMLRWLFTLDPTLAGGMAPIDALAGHRTEVRRRAALTAL
ncbi:MAG: Rv2175c family DNA-binding protein [Dermatophilaceae bacterium]